MLMRSGAATRCSYPGSPCPRADVVAPTRTAARPRARAYGACVLSFDVRSADVSGAPGVAIQGEVDLSRVQALEQALDDAIRASEGAFVIDLCDLDFLDSAGLSALMRARALLGQDERPLAVICPGGPVRRLFDVAGVADLLVLFDTRAEAAAALVPPDPA
jgi:anti-sigma B factor antagonist